jgi:hypothetical protein
MVFKTETNDIGLALVILQLRTYLGGGVVLLSVLPNSESTADYTDESCQKQLLPMGAVPQTKK